MNSKTKHMTKKLQNKFYDILEQYTCNDFDEYPTILKALQGALINTPHSMVDYIDEITVWEKIEMSFTVAVCLNFDCPFTSPL